MNQRPTARRVPANRQRPTSKQKQLKVLSYIGIIVFIAVVFVVGLTVIDSITDETRAEIRNVQDQNTALENDLKDLQDELAFIKTDKGIELYARAQGMCMPGEVRYTVGSSR